MLVGKQSFFNKRNLTKRTLPLITCFDFQRTTLFDFSDISTVSPCLQCPLGMDGRVRSASAARFGSSSSWCHTGSPWPKVKLNLFLDEIVMSMTYVYADDVLEQTGGLGSAEVFAAATQVAQTVWKWGDTTATFTTTKRALNQSGFLHFMQLFIFLDTQRVDWKTTFETLAFIQTRWLLIVEACLDLFSLSAFSFGPKSFGLMVSTPQVPRPKLPARIVALALCALALTEAFAFTGGTRLECSGRLKSTVHRAAESAPRDEWGLLCKKDKGD